MRNAKKTVIVVLCLAIVYAVLRRTYRFLFLYESAYFGGLPSAPSTAQAKATALSEPVVEYNYQRTLALIEQTQVLSQTFYAQFTGARSKVKHIDVKAAKVLLADLYREKVRLNRHMIEIKIHYKGNVPIKVANVLNYHKKVIEKCADEVAEILRKA